MSERTRKIQQIVRRQYIYSKDKIKVAPEDFIRLKPKNRFILLKAVFGSVCGLRRGIYPTYEYVGHFLQYRHHWKRLLSVNEIKEMLFSLVVGENHDEVSCWIGDYAKGLSILKHYTGRAAAINKQFKQYELLKK